MTRNLVRRGAGEPSSLAGRGGAHDSIDQQSGNHRTATSAWFVA